MNLSKTKYCKAVQCKKQLWLEENKKEEKQNENIESTLENGTEVGILAKEILGPYIDINFSENLSEMIKNTKKLLNIKKIIITEASFKYENNFCSIDILKKENDEYEIYEVKSSTQINDIYIDDVTYQTYILQKNKLNIKKIFIIYLNSEYERHGELEIKKLFKIEEVTKKVQEKLKTIEQQIEEITNMKDEPNIEIGMQCKKPYECPFFNYCTKNLRENNIFKIRRMTNTQKFKLYKKGIYEYEELLKEKIDSKFIQQIEFELYNKQPEIDKKYIIEYLKQIKEPIYFLDFETYQQAIPEFENVKPYMQIPFQYSLHYIENNKLKHKEFLAEPDIDPRRKLAEQLIKDIPKDVCTLAYNMTFEKMIIKKLSKIYPDLKEHLMNIHDNMKDLMIPFKERKYYTKEMLGSYSIKYVLPALFPNEKSLNYHNLEQIHNGKEAMTTYKELGKYTKEEQKKIKTNLLKYCELDTYAMVKIYEKLKNVNISC